MANEAGQQQLDDGGPDGSIIASPLTLTSSIATGVTSTSPTAGSGYATGAGGVVTQITSDSTGVTINTVCGQITTFALVLATAVDTSFTVTNSTVAATDIVDVSIGTYGGTADGIPVVNTVATADGSFDINLMNNGAVTLDALAVINFIVHKAVIA